MAKKRSKLPEDWMDFYRKEGRRGGLMGAKARLKALTPEQRKAIAKKAAEARWGKKAK
jgi:hypothetical protein